MNRSFLIVGIPAVLTSFGWFAFTWGLKLAAGVTAIEIVVVAAAVAFVLRRQHEKRGSRPLEPGSTPGPELVNPRE